MTRQAPEKSELVIEASVDRLGEVQTFIDERLENVGCPSRTQMQIGVAVEEIFVNIALYAYAPGTGEAVVELETSDDPAAVTIVFKDRGTPYDPLARRDPDITSSAEEGEIGGLGVFMTKKLMDEVIYEYRDGQNVLTLKKRL